MFLKNSRYVAVPTTGAPSPRGEGGEVMVAKLRPLPATLPDKHRPAIAQQRHLRLLLITRHLQIHPERRTQRTQSVIQPLRLDAQSAGVRVIILPHQKTAPMINRYLRQRLIPPQMPRSRHLRTGRRKTAPHHQGTNEKRRS